MEDKIIKDPEDTIFNIEKDVDWSLFTKQEKGIIIAAYRNSHIEHLACLDDVPIDTPDKEIEIEKIVLSEMSLNGDESESEIREKLNIMMAKGIEPIETPEDEEKWQKKIDAESKKRSDRIKKQRDDAVKEGLRLAKERGEERKKENEKRAKEKTKTEGQKKDLNTEYKEAKKVVDDYEKEQKIEEEKDEKLATINEAKRIKAEKKANKST